MLFDRYPLGKSGIYPKEFKSADLSISWDPITVPLLLLVLSYQAGGWPQSFNPQVVGSIPTGSTKLDPTSHNPSSPAHPRRGLPPTLASRVEFRGSIRHPVYH